MRFWWNRFGPMFAAEIRKRRVHHRSYSHWRWHPNEVFVRINGETHYLWRAVDHEGEVLEVLATKRRDRKAARAFLKRAMKRYGRPKAIVTDRLRSYGAAMKDIGVEQRQVCGRWLNNRAENSHQPSPTTGGRDGAVQGHQNPAEVRFRACFDPQPLQPRPPSKPTSHIQSEPLCRSS